LLLTCGIASSAFFLHAEHAAFLSLVSMHAVVVFALCVIGLCVFFFQLRLMDELKDLKKDKIANPTRPLPRGLLSSAEVARMIQRIQSIMFICSIALVLAGFVSAGIAYALTTLWLFLMFKEFFVSQWLTRRPLLYAFSHQVISILLVAFAVFLFTPFEAQGNEQISRTFIYGCAVMSGFFIYEVCRKLNPVANPILGTYFIAFGFFRTGMLVTAVAAALAFVTSKLETGLGLSASLLVFALVLGYWTVMNSGIAAKRYKLLEALASLILLHQLWSVTLSWLV
jgi:4-hydroxybenzoate polyprenyltransferase